MHERVHDANEQPLTDAEPRRAIRVDLNRVAGIRTVYVLGQQASRKAFARTSAEQAACIERGEKPLIFRIVDLSCRRRDGEFPELYRAWAMHLRRRRALRHPCAASSARMRPLVMSRPREHRACGQRGCRAPPDDDDELDDDPLAGGSA